MAGSAETQHLEIRRGLRPLLEIPLELGYQVIHGLLVNLLDLHPSLQKPKNCVPIGD